MDIFFKINLSTYSKSNIVLRVKHNDKIEDVKTSLRDRLSLKQRISSMRLFVMGLGKQLEDGRSVSDYNLHNGSIIIVRILMGSDKSKSPKPHNTSQNNTNDQNSNNQATSKFYDKIGFFPTQSKERKIPKYYDYKKVIMIIDFWCRSFGICAIQTELLDFIAIYTSYIYSKILCISENELKLCCFEVYVQLKGFNAYFKNQNREIKRLWLDQYIELKLAQIDDKNITRKVNKYLNSVNYTNNIKHCGLMDTRTLKCDKIHQSEYKNEIFVLYASMPKTLIEIYKVKGELNNMVCWVEFGFMKKQNVKVFGLRSNIFKFSYLGMNIENNKDGLDTKLMLSRQYLIDIEIVKILKRDAIHNALSKYELIQKVQKRLKHRFWPQDIIIKQRISKLSNDGYCIVVNDQLLYLDGNDAVRQVGQDHDF